MYEEFGKEAKELENNKAPKICETAEIIKMSETMRMKLFWYVKFMDCKVTGWFYEVHYSPNTKESNAWAYEQYAWLEE